jgi:hypothetical protein
MLEHLIWQEDTLQTPGGNVEILCPACGTESVLARTLDERHRIRFLGLLTVLSFFSTWVVCTRCGGRIYSPVRAGELATMSPEEIGEVIYLRASFLQRSLAVLALLVAIFPLVGVGMAAIALIATRKTQDWARPVVKVAWVIASIMTFWLVVILLMQAFGMRL